MKALSLLFIPIITTTAGNAIGTSMSKKITEYSTITRTIDLNTSKIIGEPTEIFDEKETTYVATVLVYSPWKQKIDGSGYTSNIIAYEYTVPETKEEEYQITNNIPNDNMIEKYRFTESKETLEKSDSTEHSTILITETYQDKKRTRQSTKYIIPFSIIGISIGLVVDTVLILIANFGLIKTKETLEELNDRINTEKLNKKEIQEILKEMQNEAFTLQEEYNTVVKDFGTLKDQFIVLEIEETWLENNKRKKTL